MPHYLSSDLTIAPTARSAAAPVPRDPSEPSDAELISRFRSGDAQAYGRLWARHLPASVAAARAATNRADPEDVASEAFLNVMQALLRGAGPDFAFRSYLLCAVRNTAISWGRKQAREIPVEQIELADPRFSEEALRAAVVNAMLVRGFRTLPQRWQEVLWFAEIDGLSYVEIAHRMGITPTAVASLAYRARDGLRRAWIRSHFGSDGMS